MTEKRKLKRAALPKRGGRESKEKIAQRKELLPAKPGDAPPPPLSLELMKFCTHYAIHFNASEAVRHAGIETQAPGHYGYELLTKPEIQANIRAIRAQHGEMHFDLSNQLIDQYNRMRLARVEELFTATGDIRDPRDWPEELQLLVNGVDVEERMVGEGDAQELIRTKKVKLESRKGVMDSLAKILGIAVERSDVTSGGKPLPAMTPIINVTVGGKKIDT